MPHGILICAVLASALAVAQNPAYDFYPDFLTWGEHLRTETGSHTWEQVVQLYEQKLHADGISEAEIQRRMTLIRDGKSKISMDADYWGRFFAHGLGNGRYNTAPNQFLVEVVAGLKPGTALDYGMGGGRNALYLAKLGWQVSGFDPAEDAVALAQKQARELGLKLDTAAVRDDRYDFGKQRFDLVLYSWSGPKPAYVQKVIDSLKPGGIVVVEGAAEWYGHNGILKTLDALQIMRYEVVTAKPDFMDPDHDREIVRLVARKSVP